MMEPHVLFELFATHPEGQWIIKPGPAKQLHDYVKEKQFKNILDLGTGIGCAVALMALASPKAKIDTFEDKEKCIEVAKELIPEQKNITFHHNPQMVWQHPDIPYESFNIFESLPKKKYDFILVDGPGPFLEKVNGEERFVELPNGDVLKMCLEDTLTQGTQIGWDGRRTALRTIERFYGDNFFLVHQGERTDFNVIERKPGKVQFRDVRHEDMKKYGYK